MARTVRDAAEILHALQGVDPSDQATRAAADQVRRDYTAALNDDALRGARVGVARKLFGFHPPVDALMGEALEALRQRGAELVDPIDLAFPADLRDEILEVMLFEAKAGMNEYLSGLGADSNVRSLAEVIAFNEAHPNSVMPHFGQDLLIDARQRGPLTDPKYLDALARVRRAAREDGIDRVVKEHRLDAIAAPTGSPAWLTDPLLGDHFVGSSSTPAAIAGYPHVTVPAGHIKGLPVGLSLFGPAWSETRLLGFAYAFEQATRHRRPPAL
jgi:amidase